MKPNTNLLDRMKVRAFRIVGSETEESYENTSQLLGYLSGKVRAIREIQGAASGTMTTHIDAFYRDTWHRTIHMRVHPMPEVWFYYDLLQPATAGRYYSSVFPIDPTSIIIDGSNDVVTSLTLPSWNQMSLDLGTLVYTLRELTPFPFNPSSPCYPNAGNFFYWLDDASFNDQTGSNPGAWGNNGFHLICAADTTYTPYSIALHHYFAQPQSSYAPIGAAYSAIEETPLSISATSQTRSALTNCTLYCVTKADMGRLNFEWIPALGADGYDIYRWQLSNPFVFSQDLPLVCGLQSSTSSWTTADDQVTAQPSYFYLIVPFRGSVHEYGWDSKGVERPAPIIQCP